MADVICFPQERNVGKARHVAKLYLGKSSDRDREVYWQMVIGRLTGVLERVGFSETEIDRQVTAFRCAVEDELNALSQRNNGPGAA